MSSALHCTFRLAGRLYGVEIEHVQEVLRERAMTRVPLAPAIVRGLINLRGEIVPALDLRVRLGLPRSEGESANVVLRTRSGPVSLLVDEISDVLDLSQARFELPPASLDGAARSLIRGVYELDRCLVLALDASAVSELANLSGHGPRRADAG